MSYELFDQREGAELPESVELLERPEGEQTCEAPRQETRALGDGLELDSRTREAPPEQPFFHYSEAYLTQENGTFRYHPEQINGIYRDGITEPSCETVAEELSHWRFQESARGCAVACEGMVLSDLEGRNYSMDELEAFSEERGWYQPELGTYSGDIGRISMSHGLRREQSSEMTAEDLAAAKQGGAELIVAVDEFLLQYPHLEKVCKPNHVVEVIGFDLSEQGKPKVLINDPGQRNGRGLAYPLEIFQRAACETDPSTGKKTFYHVTLITEGEERA